MPRMQTVAHLSLLNMMLSSNYDSSHGASSVVSLAEEVPGSLPRRSPPQATGEPKNRLKIFQWNCESISNKKLQLTNKLKNADIYIACMQESHLQSHPKHGNRFTIRGYQTFKQDRKKWKVSSHLLEMASQPQKSRLIQGTEQR